MQREISAQSDETEISKPRSTHIDLSHRFITSIYHIDLSHGLFADGLVVDLQQLRLVEDEFLAREASHFVVRREFDRVAGASLFAHAAVDAAQFVDIKLLRVLLAIVPRTFVGDDVNALRGARRRAHETRDTAHATVFILIEAVHAAEVGSVLAALLDGAIVTLHLWVLQHPDVLLVRAATADVLEAVAQGRAEPLEDGGEEQCFAAGEAGWGHIDDFFVADRHGAEMVRWRDER